MMGYIPVLGPLAQATSEVVQSWSERKAIETRTRTEMSEAITRARIEAEINRAVAESEWDQQQALNSQTSWKDEFWTLILAAPLVASFFPGLRPYVEAGFRTLADTVPDWYLIFVGAAVSAAFGARAIIATMTRGRR